MQQSLARLSSGLRINQTADDAAGLSIGTSMRHQLAAYAQANANVQDAVNLLQTAEDGFATVTALLHRLQELTVQAANDTSTTADREKIQSEVAQLLREIDRQAQSRLMDADMARESARLVKRQIFARASTSMVSQANAMAA